MLTPLFSSSQEKPISKINSGMYSSATDDWGTPQALFDELNDEFSFTLDACASAHNFKVNIYFNEKIDALAQRWTGTVWMNPPYGRTIGKWMKKAYEESQKGATVVCLVPARTDTAWWHDYAIKGEVRFLRGRLKFEQPGFVKNSSAPFPSAIVIFRGEFK
jgi:phage N-6-adenine-methyltransferase